MNEVCLELVGEDASDQIHLKFVKKMHSLASDDDLKVEIKMNNEGKITKITCKGSRA